MNSFHLDKLPVCLATKVKVSRKHTFIQPYLATKKKAFSKVLCRIVWYWISICLPVRRSPNSFFNFCVGSKIRLVTLDASIDLLKGMVLSHGKSFLADTHFAQLEGIKEESTLLLRNFYKVISKFWGRPSWSPIRQGMTKTSNHFNLAEWRNLLGYVRGRISSRLSTSAQSGVGTLWCLFAFTANRKYFTIHSKYF